MKYGKRNTRLVILISLVGVLFISCGVFFDYASDDGKNNLVVKDDNLLTIQGLIWQDFQNGELTADEYVRNLLYTEYDEELLSERYKTQNQDSLSAIHTNDIVNEYYDQLSSDTLNYYFDKVNLDGITFELTKENEDSYDDKIALSNLFIEDVYAKERATVNLNKVVLSSNKNFIVWYTTTGDNAISDEMAKLIADGLDDTILEYKALFGSNWSYQSNIFSKGKRYKAQLKILENANIDIKYLESAMQIYIADYTEGSDAKYVGRSGALIKLWNSLRGGDAEGVVANPYIIIKPSSLKDDETAEQYYNHELFHHYQHEILCGHSACSMYDPYIGEATANWSSALATTKTTNYGFLNNWAGDARAFSDILLSEKCINKNGATVIGYAMWVYLYNYSNIVENGTEKIINSIYSEDSFGDLAAYATKEELANIQETIALKNLSQDYDNKNANVTPGYERQLPIRVTISHKDEKYKNNNTYYEVQMDPMALHYYLIDDSSGYAYKIHLERNDEFSNEFLSATIIKFSRGKYTIVESSKVSEESYTFNTNNYGDYDKLYVVISNAYPHRSNDYTLNIKEIEKEIQQEQEEIEITDYISLLDCSVYNEYIDKVIDTIYFDGENIDRYVVTVYWNDEIEASVSYDVNSSNPSYKNVKKVGNIVMYEYTEEALQEYWSHLKKSNVVSTYNYACEGNATVDFDPESIK